MSRRPLPLLALSLVLLAACAGKSPAGSAHGSPAPGGAGAIAAGSFDAASPIAGRVLAPANIVAQGGGNIVAQGGGNIVAQGGGNLISQDGGSYHTLDVGQQPLAGTEVYLADAKGVELDGVAHAQTDAAGKYKLPAVPHGFTYLVVAKAATGEGKAVQLKTLVSVGDEGAIANLDAGSTLVTTAMIKGVDDLGEVDLTSFHRAIETVDTAQADGVDLSDPDAIDRYMDGLENQVATLKTDMSSLALGFKIGNQLDKLQQQLAALAAERAQDPTHASQLDAKDVTIPISGTFTTQLYVKPPKDQTAGILAGTTLVIQPYDLVGKAYQAGFEVQVVPMAGTSIALPYSETDYLTFGVSLHLPATLQDELVGTLTLSPGRVVTFDVGDASFARTTTTKSGYTISSDFSSP